MYILDTVTNRVILRMTTFYHMTMKYTSKELDIEQTLSLVYGLWSNLCLIKANQQLVCSTRLIHQKQNKTCLSFLRYYQFQNETSDFNRN
jgi:hypothetical protein